MPNRIPFRADLTLKARSLRKTMTPAETRLWNEVLRGRRFHGYRFLRQKPLLDYIADFYCSELRLVIELDGDSHAAQQDYDHTRTQRLAAHGITVIRYTNRDVLENLDGVHRHLTQRIGPAQEA